MDLNKDFKLHRRRLKTLVGRLKKKWPNSITNKDLDKFIEALGKIRAPKLVDGVTNKSIDPETGDPITEKIEVWGIHDTASYGYDDRKYPPINYPKERKAWSRGTCKKEKELKRPVPNNLAEAWIWKHSRWEDFENFISDFDSDFSTFDHKQKLKIAGRIVFYAFSRHLKDRKKYPIFDQHSLRALSAISDKVRDATLATHKNLDPSGKLPEFYEDPIARRYLTSVREQIWNDNSPGKIGKEVRVACYETFCSEVDRARATQKNLDLDKLDELLMPLGMALEDYSSIKKKNHYSDYCDLIGAKKPGLLPSQVLQLERKKKKKKKKVRK